MHDRSLRPRARRLRPRSRDRRARSSWIRLFRVTMQTLYATHRRSASRRQRLSGRCTRATRSGVDRALPDAQRRQPYNSRRASSRTRESRQRQHVRPRCARQSGSTRGLRKTSMDPNCARPRRGGLLRADDPAGHGTDLEVADEQLPQPALERATARTTTCAPAARRRSATSMCAPGSRRIAIRPSPPRARAGASQQSRNPPRHRRRRWPLPSRLPPRVRLDDLPQRRVESTRPRPPYVTPPIDEPRDPRIVE